MTHVHVEVEKNINSAADVSNKSVCYMKEVRKWSNWISLKVL